MLPILENEFCSSTFLLLFSMQTKPSFFVYNEEEITSQEKHEYSLVNVSEKEKER